MATPDRSVVSRAQKPTQGPKGCGARLGSLDNLESKETQELVPAELDMLRKAQEFFQTCDVEDKGFIARRDMQVQGAPAGPAHLECQTAWVSLSQVRTCPIGGVSLTEKMPSSLPWKEVSVQTLLGARSPGSLLFLAFTCYHTWEGGGMYSPL